MNDNESPIWSVVDASWYPAFYPIVGSLLGFENCSTAAEIYQQFGAKLGHSPNPYFQEAWYLAQNADVARSVEIGETPSGFSHYLQFGHIDRAPHWLFSPAYYASQFAQRGEPVPGGSVYTHFLQTGQFNGLSGHFLFDPAAFEAFSPYEIARTIPSAGPFTIFISSLGLTEAESRGSALFDPEWYLSAYPEVSAEIADGVITSALEHYLTNSHPEDYDPSPLFSEAAYREAHQDVRDAIEAGDIRSGFEHYRLYGRLEKRLFFPSRHADLNKV